jgi:HAD superfamily hydrolase (TIGR01490 family)
MEIQNPEAIAFFDFDKTILKVDSGPIYGYKIYRDGLARSFPTLKALVGGIGYKLGIVRRRKVARWGVGEYVGLTKTQIADWMRDAYPRLIRPHLSSVVVERIREHQKNGHKVGIVTASPPFFVREAEKDLKLDFAFGSDLQYKDEICTGTYAKKYLGGPSKMETARIVAESNGLTLADCWFYSDHIADFALLEAVGHPVAVNPEEKLRKIAREHGWEILEHED